MNLLISQSLDASKIKSYIQEESIYNLIPLEPIIKPKQKRYRSRYPSQNDPTGSTLGHHTTTKPRVANLEGDFYSHNYGHINNKLNASFGIPKNQIYVTPSDFLKKGQGFSLGLIFRLPQINKSNIVNEHSSQKALNMSYLEAHQCSNKKPLIPNRDQSPLKITSSPKNYIMENIATNILSSPPPQKKEYDWLKKDSYGKTPFYLSTRKKVIESEYKTLSSIIENNEELQRQRIKEIPQEEVENIRSSLKNKWISLNDEYQRETHVKDVRGISKIKKKLDLEGKLLQIEQDLEKLNKSKILVDFQK